MPNACRIRAECAPPDSPSPPPPALRSRDASDPCQTRRVPLEHPVGASASRRNARAAAPRRRVGRQPVGTERLDHARRSGCSPTHGRRDQADELARTRPPPHVEPPRATIASTSACGAVASDVDDVRRHLHRAVPELEPERLHAGQPARRGAHGSRDGPRVLERAEQLDVVGHERRPRADENRPATRCRRSPGRTRARALRPSRGDAARRAPPRAEERRAPRRSAPRRRGRPAARARPRPAARPTARPRRAPLTSTGRERDERHDVDDAHPRMRARHAARGRCSRRASAMPASSPSLERPRIAEQREDAPVVTRVARVCRRARAPADANAAPIAATRPGVAPLGDVRNRLEQGHPAYPTTDARADRPRVLRPPRLRVRRLVPRPRALRRS